MEMGTGSSAFQVFSFRRPIVPCSLLVTHMHLGNLIAAVLHLEFEAANELKEGQLDVNIPPGSPAAPMMWHGETAGSISASRISERLRMEARAS